MQQILPSITSHDLYGRLGTASAPMIVDVRSDDDVHAIDRLIPGAIHRPNEDAQSWWRDLPAGCLVVVCDLSGSAKSWKVTESLHRCGTDAGYLVDGFLGWHERGLPTRKIVAEN